MATKKTSTKKKAATKPADTTATTSTEATSAGEASSEKAGGEAPRAAAGIGTPGFQPMASEDAELTPEQLKLLFDKLMEERQRVIDGFRRHVGEVIQDGDQLADELDLSARNSEQAYLLRFADKERKLLDEIDHALQKMEIGEYGVCEGTGEPITFRRLELRPWTRYSVAFKEQLERWKVD